MRTIKQTSVFKRDFRREARGQHHAWLAKHFVEVVRALAEDRPLTERFHDHSLFNDWQGHRDCHLRPDLVLIYRLPDADSLELVRLGTHSELGL
jgi:mRNA interferase YafQ